MLQLIGSGLLYSQLFKSLIDIGLSLPNHFLLCYY